MQDKSLAIALATASVTAGGGGSALEAAASGHWRGENVMQSLINDYNMSSFISIANSY